MKNTKPLIFAVVLVLIAGTAGALSWLKTHQALGQPAIIATAIPGSVKMDFDLPAHVAGFTSTNEPENKTVVETLPPDTSYAQRRYVAPDDFWVNANIVLMGTDRTSIHRPQACLPGQGWRINKKTLVNIPIAGARSYQLPVMKWEISNLIQTKDGKKMEVSGLYVFWFAAKNEETTSHVQRLWWMTRDLLTTGVLQRWAYVSYFTICAPGQEDATFARVKKLIAESVPEFQLAPQAEK